MATKNDTTGRDSDKFMLRLPDGMRDRIAEAARAANRSMNAEVVARLAASFDDFRSPMDAEAMRAARESIEAQTKESMQAAAAQLRQLQKEMRLELEADVKALAAQLPPKEVIDALRAAGHLPATAPAPAALERRFNIMRKKP